MPILNVKVSAKKSAALNKAISEMLLETTTRILHKKRDLTAIAVDYIDPDDCIDCGACVPECPVEAIFLDVEVPEKWSSFVQLNADRVKVLKPLGANITEKQTR